jgi:hypothetical protein
MFTNFWPFIWDKYGVVFEIRDIWIRIRGSVSLTNESGSSSGYLLFSSVTCKMPTRNNPDHWFWRPSFWEWVGYLCDRFRACTFSKLIRLNSQYRYGQFFLNFSSTLHCLPPQMPLYQIASIEPMTFVKSHLLSIRLHLASRGRLYLAHIRYNSWEKTFTDCIIF